MSKSIPIAAAIWLADHVNFAPAGVVSRVANSPFFDFRDARRNADNHPIINRHQAPLAFIYPLNHVTNHFSAASKSAMTPSRNGLIVLILSCVRSCICIASFPTAKTLPLLLSKAIIEGSSMTTLSLQIIIVLAVPKSIAKSLEKKIKYAHR